MPASAYREVGYRGDGVQWSLAGVGEAWGIVGLGGSGWYKDVQ